MASRAEEQGCGCGLVILGIAGLSGVLWGRDGIIVWLCTVFVVLGLIAWFSD